jgi:hypothetical protein
MTRPKRRGSGGQHAPPSRVSVGRCASRRICRVGRATLPNVPATPCSLGFVASRDHETLAPRDMVVLISRLPAWQSLRGHPVCLFAAAELGGLGALSDALVCRRRHDKYAVEKRLHLTGCEGRSGRVSIPTARVTAWHIWLGRCLGWVIALGNQV